MRSWANHRFCRLFLSQRNLPRMFWSQFSAETGEHHCQRNPCQVVRPQGYEGWTVGGICTEFWVESSKMFCSKQDKKLLEALASLASFMSLFIVHQLSPKNSWFFTGTMRAAGAWTCLPRRRPQVAWPRQTWRRTSGAKLCPGQICKDTYCRYTVPPEN